MKTFNEVINDITQHLINVPLNSISGRASAFSICSIDLNKHNYIILLSDGQKKSRPIEELEKIWNVILSKGVVHVESLLSGSGSSRNQPETILANLPYIEWLQINNKKHICYTLKNSHPYGTLKEMESSDQNQIVNQLNKTISNHTCLYTTNIKCNFSRNRIVFGAPGTGKSFLINKESKILIEAYNAPESNIERVTFHPDYSYANFVGSYKPVMLTISDPSIDTETKEGLRILRDKNKSAQEKYDFLYTHFKDIGLTRLPIILGIATDETFHTMKIDGEETANDNNVERNHGIALRRFVELKGNSSKRTDSEISYEFVPGPFMRMYVKALRNIQKVTDGTEEPQPFILIIEEINRANVAAVFGDIFQLLDRKDNVSEYPIQASEDIKKFLATQLGGSSEDYSQIKIPDNLFIWATMNSADQGVFPMDTAFKRRWDFKYLGIDDNSIQIAGKYITLGKTRVEWDRLRKAINDFLADNLKVPEDKQIGPFFLPKSIVVPEDNITEIDVESFCDAFKNKVLMYLFEDAARQKRASLFECSVYGTTRYSKICEAFDKQGIGIFNKEIQNRVDHTPPLPEVEYSEEETNQDLRDTAAL